jgi:hypothetical protein
MYRKETAQNECLLVFCGGRYIMIEIRGERIYLYPMSMLWAFIYSG